MAHLKLLIEQYRSKKIYPELVSILQMRSDISTKIARSATKRGQHGPLLLKTSDDFS
jgi:hypothetical protein